MSLARVPSAATRVAVTVTFLRMDAPPLEPAPAMPEGGTIVRLGAPSVGFYRYLYDTVGVSHLWWLRRTLPDMQVAAMLRDPRVGIFVLYRQGEPAGFFELDLRAVSVANLSYFGLMPSSLGKGFGRAMLRASVDTAFGLGARAITVNTCTADHPRALPTYLRCGFRPVRAVREVWDVPVHLGMVIAEHLKV
jgi:GNAT superfamily N-acetyltransferase